jgi:hypothetical protein
MLGGVRETKRTLKLRWVTLAICELLHEQLKLECAARFASA